MPINDEDLLGRIRDYLAIIIEGINEKCLILSKQLQANTDRNSKITTLISEAETSLTHILDSQQQLEKDNIGVLDDLTDKVQNAFLSLGLSESQETEILDLFNAAEKKSLSLFEKSAQVSKELQSIVDKFNQLKE